MLLLLLFLTGCRGRMDRHVILDNIELVLLTFDEVVDGGCVLASAANIAEWFTMSVCMCVVGHEANWRTCRSHVCVSAQHHLGSRHAVDLEPRADAGPLRCFHSSLGFVALTRVCCVSCMQGIDNEVPIGELTISQVRSAAECCQKVTKTDNVVVWRAGVRVGPRAVLALVPQLKRE